MNQNPKPYIGISRCFLGEDCTYKQSHHTIKELDELKELVNFVGVCPEVMGGLSIPRDPAEITNQLPLRVTTCKGNDVTNEYVRGAKLAKEELDHYDIRYVLLKHKSPSCGCDGIYDGTFQHKVIAGQGIFAHKLAQEGYCLYHEEQINELIKEIREDIQNGSYIKD